MAYQKLQTTSGINVVPSGDINIPSPASEFTSGAATASAASPNLDRLTDSSGNFETKGVSVGDVVYVLHVATANQITTVASVDSETQLTLSDEVSFISGDSYRIFRAGENNGCIIYIGTSTNNAQPITIETAAGDEVTLKNVIQGSFLPVQVVKVFSSGTSVSDIVAFW